MEFSFKRKALSRDISQIRKVPKGLIHERGVIADVIDVLSDYDESYYRICRALRNTGTTLEKNAHTVSVIEETLIEIADLYEKAEKEICDFLLFKSIPDDKKIKLEPDLLKKLVIEDTDHTVEIIDPFYFSKNIKDNVDPISAETVIWDCINTLYLVMTNDPRAEEAQIDFTINSQAMFAAYLAGLLNEAVLGKVLSSKSAKGIKTDGIIEDDDMDDAVKFLSELNVLTPEYIAYGILIDGVSMAEYMKNHPEEFYDDTTMLAQRDRNRAAKEKKKKQKKIA